MADSYYKSGDWNAVCALCGRQKKASELRRQWQGYYVCAEHWEPRHPQDFVRARPEKMNVPWVQVPVESATDLLVCDMYSMSSYAGYSTADCWIAGYFPTL